MASPPADAALLSSRSGRVKTARRLARRVFRGQTRLFLAEGPQAVREALALPGCVSEIFATIEAAEHDRQIHQSALRQAVPWQLVDPEGLASLAETVHPQGLVAVCRFLDRPLDDVLIEPQQLVVVCADVRDPGNAGTVIRCADAAGADAVVLSGSSVDLYNGKTVRASAGSLFHVPLAVHPDTGEAVRSLQGRDFTVLAADGDAHMTLDDAVDEEVLVGRTAWLFGNEAWGLPPEVAALADHRIAIPIHGRAESLNLATAAAVCLYASARAQRR